VRHCLPSSLHSSQVTWTVAYRPDVDSWCEVENVPLRLRPCLHIASWEAEIEGDSCCQEVLSSSRNAAGSQYEAASWSLS
jgi:hypothetical protein